MVLELQVVAVLPEQLPHLQGHRPGLLIVPRQQQPGELPAQTGGAGDQTAAVLPQQVHVDPWLDVEPLQIGLGHHVGEVAVALLVPAQEDQMAGLRVQLVDLLEPGAAPGGHIDLTADDGLDARRLTGLIEVDHPIHHPVVGDGHRLLPQVLHPLHQFLDAAGPVQQGKLCMEM